MCGISYFLHSPAISDNLNTLFLHCKIEKGDDTLIVGSGCKARGGGKDTGHCFCSQIPYLFFHCSDVRSKLISLQYILHHHWLKT